MLARIALAASLVAVAGCASLSDRDAVVLAASPTSVTLRFDLGDLPDATARAEAWCGQHGRTARLQRVSPAEGDDQIANFDCVSRT